MQKHILQNAKDWVYINKLQKWPCSDSILSRRSLYRVYHLKRSPETIIYYGTKLNQKQVHPHVMNCPNLPRDTGVKITFVARPLLTPVAQRLCRCEHGLLCSEAHLVFIWNENWSFRSFFYRASFPSYRNQFHRDLNQLFGAVVFVTAISSSRQATLVLAPLLYLSLFPNYWNHLRRDSNPGPFFRGYVPCSCNLLVAGNNFGLVTVQITLVLLMFVSYVLYFCVFVLLSFFREGNVCVCVCLCVC
jgi:hypothetical protein